MSHPEHLAQLHQLPKTAWRKVDDHDIELTVEDIEVDVAQDPLGEIRVIPDPVLPIVRVSVVIPTFNETHNLPHVVERMPSEVFEVILVDGDSTDGTVEHPMDSRAGDDLAAVVFPVPAHRRSGQGPARGSSPDGAAPAERSHPGSGSGIAAALGCWPHLTVIKQTGKGKGNALTCGFRAATGDIIVMLNGDESTDPAEIHRFLAALVTGADFANGSRFMARGGSADITRLRHIGNWGLAKIVNSLSAGQYSDLCYGYNAFWRRCLPFITPDCQGFEVETLLNIRAARARLRVHAVPSFKHDRRHGVSNLRAPRDGMRVLRANVPKG